LFSSAYFLGRRDHTSHATDKRFTPAQTARPRCDSARDARLSIAPVQMPTMLSHRQLALSNIGRLTGVRIDPRRRLMRIGLAGLLSALFCAAVAIMAIAPAHAQSGTDRPGGDYARFVVPSGDPAMCAARCDREPRCRAWTFSYPGTVAVGGGTSATCWLKSEVKPRVENPCCVSGVKGAGLIEARAGPVEMAIDRTGGDYRFFDLASDPTGQSCKSACEGDNRCRAWTYVRPGYLGPASARCYLKDRITRPRRKPCCMSGVVR
jgi:hypothetical protein